MLELSQALGVESGEVFDSRDVGLSSSLAAPVLV